MNQYFVTASPAVEPVTVAEAKEFLRVSSGLEDVMIGALIVAARSWVENVTRRALIQQSLAFVLDKEPEKNERGRRMISLPCPPLVSVMGVTAYDDENQSSDVDAVAYWAEGAGAQGQLVLKEVAAFNRLRVDYVAGYGPSASDVPEALRVAIKQLVAFWYEHRGDAVNGSDNAAVPASVLALVAPYRVLRAG